MLAVAWQSMPLNFTACPRPAGFAAGCQPLPWDVRHCRLWAVASTRLLPVPLHPLPQDEHAHRCREAPGQNEIKQGQGQAGELDPPGTEAGRHELFIERDVLDTGIRTLALRTLTLRVRRVGRHG